MMLLSCLLPIVALADTWQDPETKVNYTYTVGNSEAIVTAGSDSKAGSPSVEGDIEILSKFIVDGNEYAVTSIGEYAFRLRTKLTGVTIPSSVTSIGRYAFWNCTKLTSVKISEGVKNIGFFAFNGCSSLTNFNIPSSVTSIESTFSGTAWYNNQPDGILYYDNWLLGYKGNKPTGNITIIEGTKGIAGSSFFQCPDITSITIPHGVISIGEMAFTGCKGLSSIIIPEGVTNIDYSVFSACSGLTNVTIPASVTTIGTSAFSGCSALSSITIPNSVTTIGNDAFYGCKSLTCITIPYGVVSLGSWAFGNCTSLTSISIPPSVTNISSAFYNCNGLTEVHISDLSAWCGLKIDGRDGNPLFYAKHLFLNDTEITDLVIPDDVTRISNHAFTDCISLKSVTIPEGVKSIGYLSFGYCTNLSNVITLIRNPYDIDLGGFAFYGSYDKAALYVPKGSKEKYEAAYGWKEFETIIEVSNQTKGDVNDDGNVDVADIGTVIDVMASGTNDTAADVNGDGKVDVADISTIIDIMAGK